MQNNKLCIKHNQFDNICRFCLKNDFILKPIFQEGSENAAATEEVDEWDEFADPNYEYLNIADYVRIITGLQIEENDPYPKFLCLTCLGVIKTLREFQSKCIASFEVLQDVQKKYRTRKDSGTEDDIDDVDDYGLDMQISDLKYMEGFPEDEFDQPESELFTDPVIRFDVQIAADVKKLVNPAKELDLITTELDKTHITTEQDTDICPDLWRAATVWSKFIINMDSIVYDNYTEYTIFVDGGLTNSEKEFSCKIRLMHSDWKKSSCVSCNPAAEPSMCEHILALVLNLGVAVAPERLVPIGWN